MRYWLSVAVNLLLHVAAMALFTAVAFIDYLVTLARMRGKITLHERARWLHRTCGRALPNLGVHTHLHGSFPVQGLIVANHLSYLDILVFSAIAPCVFVSKKEVRAWPIFGLLAKMAGTRFLDRERASDAHRVRNEAAGALADGVPVVVFPEGTSTDGSTVLPFKPALFEAAISSSQPVTPACLRYAVERGSAENDVCYWGEMTFFPHLLRLLSKPATHAYARFGESQIFATRREAAEASQKQVAEMLSQGSEVSAGSIVASA